MKRSTKYLTAAAAVALTGAAALPLASTFADSGSKRVHLALLEQGTALHIVDAVVPEADGQAGDVGIFESDLLVKGTKVGTLEGWCLQMRADGSLDDCSVTVTVGTDSYRMAGPFDPATGGTLTIVGGTGAWVGASGTDRIVNNPDGTATHNVDLVRD